MQQKMRITESPVSSVWSKIWNASSDGLEGIAVKARARTGDAAALADEQALSVRCGIALTGEPRSRPDGVSLRRMVRAIGRRSNIVRMKFLDPDTEAAVRLFLARLPSRYALEFAVLFGSRARGEGSPDSDADVALIVGERADDWQLLGDLAELAYYVFLESGIMIQPVPIALQDWNHPEGFMRPGFLRNVAREGIVL